MEVETLLRNCETDDERRTILTLIGRAQNKPAVVVTVDGGSGKRRYVVAREDEHLFDGLDGPQPEPHGMAGMMGFGAQWLRKMGKVDEMYRTLSRWEVTKVERIDRKRVWGS